jgi:hypothetical protein
MNRSFHSALSAFAAAAVLVAPAAVSAQAFQSKGTIKAGTKIACVLDETVNSKTLQPGTDFKLKVVDPNQPSLQGAEIHGHVTDVEQPGGTDRAKIGFLLDYIRFKDGSKTPIRAYVVSRQVVYTNTAAKQQAMAPPPPMLPNGTVTPGPIAWQMRIGGGGSKPVSVNPPNTGQSGGYIYSKTAGGPIVIQSGASVTVELTNDLVVT